jgi:sec-independent protein translocase protein TatC
MVWLGKKVIDLRQKLSVKRQLIPEDEEKPFLDHLEDLRKTLTRIIATLLIGMIGCFIFKEQIFRIIQLPINAAEIGVLDREQSPLGLKDPAEWPQVASIAYGLLGLDESQRTLYLNHAFTPQTDHLRPVVDALLLRHAALALPEERRADYLVAATAGNDPLATIVSDMELKKVDASFERGPKHMNLRFFKPGEGFNLSMKLSLYAGIIIGFPLLLYFLLEFIVPGLRPEERRILWPSLATGFGLFLVGVLFAYFLVTPNALRWLYNYDLALGGTTEYRFTDYASFVVQFTLIFGLCFELPVIVFALNKLGILGYELMRNTRSYAIIIIVVISALLTPTTDLINLSLLAIPMVVLYEISIWIAFFHEKGVAKREAAEEAADRAARQARRERAAMAGAYLDPAPGVAPAHATHPANDPFHHDPHSHDHPAFPHDHDQTHDAHGTDDHHHHDYHAHDHHHHGHDGPEPGSALTGPPATDADSYRDRAESWHPAPTPPTDAAPPSDAPDAPATPDPSGAGAEPGRPAPTPGEPSEESRRHID